MENDIYVKIPECPEPPSMYWEGEDGEGYKEDGCPWLFTE